MGAGLFVVVGVATRGGGGGGGSGFFCGFVDDAVVVVPCADVVLDDADVCKTFLCDLMLLILL